MDKRIAAVLTTVIDASKNGDSVVLSRIELKEAIPDKNSVTDEELDEILRELDISELIKIKYRDENDYCVQPLQKGRFIVENERKALPASDIKFKINLKRIVVAVFTAAFFGSLTAVGLCVLGLYLAGRL